MMIILMAFKLFMTVVFDEWMIKSLIYRHPFMSVLHQSFSHEALCLLTYLRSWRKFQFGEVAAQVVLIHHLQNILFKWGFFEE